MSKIERQVPKNLPLFFSSSLETHIKIFVFLIAKIFLYVLSWKCQEDTWMKSYSSQEIIKMLKADGWYEVNVEGSHHQYKHSAKKGRTTVKHPDKDIPTKTH